MEQTSPSSASRSFVDALEREGFTFYSGVPCTLLKGAIKLLESDPRLGYVSATREDAAIGAAVGACLGGGKAVVLMPNSGIGVSLTALASLAIPYRLPVLLVVSDWTDAEPTVAGLGPWPALTRSVLEPLDVTMIRLTAATVSEQVAAAAALMAEARRPVALLVGGGVLQ